MRYVREKCTMTKSEGIGIFFFFLSKSLKADFIDHLSLTTSYPYVLRISLRRSNMKFTRGIAFTATQESASTPAFLFALRLSDWHTWENGT